MPRSKFFALVLATLSASAPALLAQNADPAGSANTLNYTQDAAPIQRSQPAQPYYPGGYGPPAQATTQPPPVSIASSQPVQGVLVRSLRNTPVETVTTDANRLELRLTHGIANIDVHDPEQHRLILVDLPGGQTQLLKNGLYTFNADTNTVRVLHGEADAFPGSNPSTNPTAKPIKVKEDHQLSFVGSNIHATDFDYYQATTDLLPTNHSEPLAYNGGGAGYGYPVDAPYYYYDPYWAYGYPFGWGWGWGWGYGGYYGRGFYGGGFRGGYGGGGGFHGGGGGGGHR
jgi:hypothetical protein